MSTFLFLKGQCHDVQWFFCSSKKWRLLTQVSRISDSQSQAAASPPQLSRENVVFFEQLSFSEALPCGRHYFSPHKMAAKNHRLSWHCRFKGSVERSMLLWAIFLLFTQNRPWESEDHLCTLFLIEMSKERLEKTRKNIASFVASLGAGVQPRSTVQLQVLMPVAVLKNGRFRSFFSALGVIWREKAFRDEQCQFLIRNEFEQRKRIKLSMTSECVRTDSILPRGAGLEHGSKSMFSLSIFGNLVERLSF